ncbi:hypothetical protein FJTKL_05750 [Diaporthe vaccinii]|uniref:Uncharacterized protein n=1 Tax=Diaporthe vaccinii TaxID=105482 RepID=A0ABR4EY75_9PEZI
MSTVEESPEAHSSEPRAANGVTYVACERRHLMCDRVIMSSFVSLCLLRDFHPIARSRSSHCLLPAASSFRRPSIMSSPNDWLGKVKNRKRVALLAATMGTGNKYKNKMNSIHTISQRLCLMTRATTCPTMNVHPECGV